MPMLKSDATAFSLLLGGVAEASACSQVPIPIWSFATPASLGTPIISVHSLTAPGPFNSPCLFIQLPPLCQEFLGAGAGT